VVFPLDGLAEAQRGAVTHSGSPLVVLGGAGTGKTSVIEARFTWLVEQGYEPERIAVLCPAASGSIELRSRLEQALRRGYEELIVATPVELAALLLGGADAIGAGDRLAMLIDRIDELSVRHHDFGGNATALIGGFVRRIDRCKAELIDAEQYASWALSSRRDRMAAATHRWSASSPRSTGLTSVCSPERADGTPAI
jgi:DNA helicase II / ATP-dependent DNA helicase PcrA